MSKKSDIRVVVELLMAAAGAYILYDQFVETYNKRQKAKLTNKPLVTKKLT